MLNKQHILTSNIQSNSIVLIDGIMEGCLRCRSASGAGLQESLALIFCHRAAESVHDRVGSRNNCCCCCCVVPTPGCTNTDASAWAWPISVAEANGNGFLAATLPLC